MLFTSVAFLREGFFEEAENKLTDIVSLPGYTTWIAQALRYIPPEVVGTWRRRHYLVVFGIPSMDINERQVRRSLQRQTCWGYTGVARSANHFVGEMLILFALGHHPTNNYVISSSAIEEAQTWKDVIMLPLYEGRPTTTKKIGGAGKWGTEAEIGMSRKTFMWLQLAVRLFSGVPYIAKGDDDMFMRVPQYLADLRSLPRRGLYWGTIGSLSYKGAMVQYAYGWCYTLSVDVVRAFLAYEPLRRAVFFPYSEKNKAVFEQFYMGAEDVMVGLVLNKAGYYPNMYFVQETECSFYDLRVGYLTRPLRNSAVVVHHVGEEDYRVAMDKFENVTASDPRHLTRIRKGVGRFSCTW
ncbi:putative phosphoglycan beta 1,3 galactosyltransferase [Trypanosoma vivax]|nr:putative phosphoglycan beta 1,3 galactosyltransferase [Trypanosoma vivax]